MIFMKKNLLVMLAFFAATSFLPAQTLFNKAAFKVEKNNSDLLTVTAGKEVFKVHLVGGYIDMGKDKGFIFKDTFADAKGQAIQGAEKTKLRYQAARLVNDKLHLTLGGNIPNENFKDYFVFKRFEIAPEMQNIISVITFIGRNKNKAVKLPKDAALSVISSSGFKTAARFEFSGEKPLDLTAQTGKKFEFLPIGTQYTVVDKKYNVGLIWGEMLDMALENSDTANVTIKTKAFKLKDGLRFFWGRYVPEKPASVFKDFTLEHGYNLENKIASRASLHLHSMYYPGYTHAPVLPPVRLKEYRDAQVSPRYGFAVLSEHDRIVLPETCEPIGAQPQWGVEGIVFVPGIEKIWGNRYDSYKRERMRAEFNVIGVSREKIKPFEGSQISGRNQRKLKHNRWPDASYPQIMIKEMINEGIFVSLCHPECQIRNNIHHWKTSGYNWDEMDLIFGNPNKGMPGFEVLPQALEIGNQGYDFSIRTNYTNAENKWDHYLSRGHRISGTASDDAHGKAPFAGWIVVFVDKIDQASLMKALKSGNYYSSQGPELKNISIKDKTLTVESVKPARIEFIGLHGKVLAVSENVTKASYTAKGDELYIRAKVTHNCPEMKDIKAKNIHRIRSAWTNPVYLKGK